MRDVPATEAVISAREVPLEMDVLVLGGWLIVSFLIAARFFRWQ